jgi:hypothetical protein
MISKQSYHTIFGRIFRHIFKFKSITNGFHGFFTTDKHEYLSNNPNLISVKNSFFEKLLFR